MASSDEVAAWCLGLSIFLSVIFLLITVFMAFSITQHMEMGAPEPKKKTFKQKCLYWVMGLMSVNFWIYGPFILYGLYLMGTRVIASINYLQRTEQVIPKTPETIDLNKAEKTK